MTDFFSLADGPGRTYMHYTGTPEFRFGEGLSYTQWGLDWADNNDETCSRAISSLPGVLSASCEQKDVGQLGEATYVVRFHAWDPEPVDAEAPHLGNPALDLFGCESTLPGDSRASGRDACFHVSSILGVVWKGSIPTSVSDGLTGGPADVARDRRREER